MSTSSKLTISLGEQQLAKLTSESPEIRMRALEQVETRFIRCLQHGEKINFKPVLLLKQLIRWFGFTPPSAPDRVLALMLELLRSEYGNAVVQKIPCQRLQLELAKIRKILNCLQTKRAIELLDNLQSLTATLYKEANPSPSNSSGESHCSSGEMELFSLESFEIGPGDFEPAWTCASVDDLATMKTMVDTLTIDNDQHLQENITNLQIKLCDYPVEQLLQPPHIFLQLLHVQQLQAGETLLHVNRSLYTIVKLLQRRLSIRSKSLDHALSFKPETEPPQQLRVSCALAMILNGCLELIGPPLLEHCSHNWHLIDLSVEVIKTFADLNAPVPEKLVQRLGLIVPKLIRYCCSFEVSNSNDTPNIVKKLMIPRLESLIFNGLLLDVVTLNVSTHPRLENKTARALLQPLILDSSYLSCVPMRMNELCNLCGVIYPDTPADEQEMLRLKQAYSLALSQLVAETKLPPMELLQEQEEICFVLALLGSESLVKHLIQALVKCTCFYIAKPELRQVAESLLYTLFALPDVRLNSYALRLLKQPVVEHFHAFMNNTNYMTGCRNIELAKNHILGIPMSSQLLRKLLDLGWHHQQQPQLQQWCVDYLIMVMGLAKLVSCKDFSKIFMIVLPVVPLLVCRSIGQPQLQHMLWELFDPDCEYVEPPQALRGNVCYLFHPDAKFRKDAIGRVAYILVWQDHQNKYRPAMDKLCLDFIGHDVCAIQPPVNYFNIFSERSNLPIQRSLQALLRLLETPDLKPAIRKSTLVQLNVLLQNWEAVEVFTNCDGAYVLCLKALHDPLLRDRGGCADDTDTLLPAVSILLKVLFRSARFRHEFKDNSEMLVCLLRCLFLLPHEAQLRAEVSTCIFQLLFHEHITATDVGLKLNVDLSAMVVPVSYELDDARPPSVASEGLIVQQNLIARHFDGNASIDAQHWRIYVALRLGPAEDLSLSAVQELDIRESLKLKPADLALIQASLVHQQVQNQLIEANNCSSHESLQQLVASIQLFLVLLRNNMLPAQCTSLWMLMHKYLRLMPGNDADRQLYIALLELCLSCLRIRMPAVLSGLSNALETDAHHSFLMILRDHNVSLNLLHLVTDCIVELLRWHRHDNDIIWHVKLFEELSTLARSNFELRNLQHVRCLLTVLRQLSERPLHLDNTKIQAYYQHYVQLSSNLRTTTQTGAQWQRDCLLIICHLHTQSKLQPLGSYKNTSGSKVMRYLLGLCGHSDAEVRTLAWVSLAYSVKSSGNNMVSILVDFHDFLPGGLAACCITTKLDGHEQQLVRELSGRVFELLMPHIGETACSELLMYHSFLKRAHLALSALQLSAKRSQEPQITKANSSCELISCYVSICVRLVVLQPKWCAVLCEHAFMNALSDVLKIPTPGKPYCSAYLELCAGQICKLYALCYVHNFEFLQRSICRDPVLLKSFFSLINDVLDQKVVPENQLVQMLKLLMVFCKDPNAYDFLCDKFIAHPELLFDLLLYGLNQILIHRTVQRYTLAALSLLLIKTQEATEERNLLRVFEAYVEEVHPSDTEKDEEEDSDFDSDDKENNINSLNKQLKILSLKPLTKPKLLSNTKQSSSSAGHSKEFTNTIVLLYHSLDQLFELHYPAKTYSFLQAPTKSHVQVCEVLGNLLKQSSWVVDAARQFKLLERVIYLLETFLDDASVGNATVYVRRVGAHKSRDIINNLLVLLNMLMHWHNTPQSVITDPVMAARVVRVLVRIWPWLSHSAVLKHMTVRLTTLLTEHSFEMCKQTSQVLSSQSHSLLQLMVRVADHETTKKETPNVKSEFTKGSSDSIIEAALRVMINCCSCAEGRLSLGKMRVLDMFDTILPATINIATKVKPEVLLGWLAFWEIFSRYELGCKICHLHGLLNTVRRSPPLSKLRLRCLRILRNMCFSNSNRMQLVNMPEFINLLRDISAQPVQDGTGGGDTHIDSYAEHHLVVLCLWKLFGFTAKCKAMLRGTKLDKQLRILLDHLLILKAERPQQYQKIPFAVQLKDLLGKLFDSLQP